MAEAAKIEGPWNAVRRVRICHVNLSRTDTGKYCLGAGPLY